MDNKLILVPHYNLKYHQCLFTFIYDYFLEIIINTKNIFSVSYLYYVSKKFGFNLYEAQNEYGKVISGRW